MAKRQPIQELVLDSETPSELRQKLIIVNELRQFANTNLSLPVVKQYSSYVDLKRPYVVWNVFASPALSLEPQTWCYPIAGCAIYRGYYSEQNARREADKLASSGLDVFVGGVKAYSTLGWFSDPILNTFVEKNEYELAELIFHELAHQVLYVKDDSTFNESFATTIARVGLKRLLAAKNDPEAYAKFAEKYRQQEFFSSLVLKYRNQLAELYREDTEDTQKHRVKSQLLEQLRDEYQNSRLQNYLSSNYDDWFSGEINNAKLNTVVAYFDLVPHFESRLEELDQDLEAFYQYCLELKRLSKPLRHKKLMSKILQTSM